MKANDQRAGQRGFTESMIMETLIASLALLALVGAAAHVGETGNKKQQKNLERVLVDR